MEEIIKLILIILIGIFGLWALFIVFKLFLANPLFIIVAIIVLVVGASLISN